MLPPELLALVSGITGALLAASVNLLVGRNKPVADKQAGDASQIQALLAAASYWEAQSKYFQKEAEAQAKRFQKEIEAWQLEASDWHEKFYRGMAQFHVLAQSTEESNRLAKSMIQSGTTPLPGKDPNP